MNEGVIKFQSINVGFDEISTFDFGTINPIRKQCHKMGFIGINEDGIGFGNLSIRVLKSNHFIITASATGHRLDLEPKDYVKIIDLDILQNNITYLGTKEASSESLTHAAVYSANSQIKAVLHIHHTVLWNKLIFKVPTTDENISYGTVEMAQAISNLIRLRKLNEGILVMAGHQDGLIAFAKNPADCLKIITRALTD
jgi:hypothetical protein